MISAALAQRVELFYLLVLKDLKVRYNSNVLGYVWAVINPFAFAFVYGLAFKFIMRVQMENWQIPLLMAVQLAFTYPLGLTLGLMNVFVHDIEYLVGIGFSLLFFATPIVYPIEMVPTMYRDSFQANPLHMLVASWRSVLFHGSLNPEAIFAVLGCGWRFPPWLSSPFADGAQESVRCSSDGAHVGGARRVEVVSHGDQARREEKRHSSINGCDLPVT